MSTRDYKSPREIVIRVKGNRRVEADVKTTRKGKGSVPPSKGGRRFLKRRKKPGKGINFYDLAQISNGSGGWNDLNYQLPKTPDQGPGVLVPPALVSADFDALTAAINAIPTADLTTKTRRITKGSLSGKYGVIAAFGAFNDFLDNLEQWTTEGLQVEQADLDSTGLTLSDFNPFFDIVILKDGVGSQKITTGPTYAAAAVPFSPAVQMDVFLPPQLGNLRGLATTPDFGDLGDYGELYLSFPRRFIVNSNDPYQGGDLSYSPPPGSGMDADTLAAINAWKTIVPGRGYFYTYLTNTWTGPGETFPPAGHITRAIGFDRYPAFLAGPNGVLLAIVKKAGVFYYFWTTGF